MRYTVRLTLLLVLALVSPGIHSPRAAAGEDPPRDAEVLERIPERYLAKMEARNAQFEAAQAKGDAPRFVVEDLQKWNPEFPVTVAFRGGSTTLHKAIAEAAQAISDSCALKLDFGLDAATGTYRTWTTQDTAFAAHIRVSFDLPGYWSLVGTDSVNPAILDPGESSLNLSGFDVVLPAKWKGVARHEFLHAVGFHHEHQHPTGPCQGDFRWEDDPGYAFKQSTRREYVVDDKGRRPGIYTWLSGFPNFWQAATVDHNLKPLPAHAGTATGPFDRASVMLYRFQSFFYRTANSECMPLGEGLELSEGDKAGLLRLYPRAPAEAARILEERYKVFEGLRPEAMTEGLKTFLEKERQRGSSRR